MFPAFFDETAKILLLDPLYSERRSADHINVQRISLRLLKNNLAADHAKICSLLLRKSAPSTVHTWYN